MADLCRIKRKGQDKGTYILLACLDRTQKIKPGRLPEAVYKRGTYLYVGRARTGLSARIERHLRKQKKLFWHIDYLLTKATIKDIWVRADYFAECVTIREIGNLCPGPYSVIKGFGSSDCRCPGHLVYLPSRSMDLAFIKIKMDFDRVGIDGNHI